MGEPAGSLFLFYPLGYWFRGRLYFSLFGILTTFDTIYIRCDENA